MKLRSMDLIITVGVNHSDEPSEMLDRGYQFVCSDIDMETFLARDCEVDTPSRHVIACPNENGVNFYAKKGEQVSKEQ